MDVKLRKYGMKVILSIFTPKSFKIFFFYENYIKIKHWLPEEETHILIQFKKQ